MPIEQRVISSQKIGAPKASIGGGSAAKEPPAPAKEPKKSHRLRTLVLVVAGLAVVAAGVWFFLLRGPAGPAEEPAPVPGAVLAVDPVSLNLSEGHYLRLGFALQLTADVGEETPDTSQAVDLAIALFSGHTVAEISDPATREALKAQFAAELSDAYDGEVMGVYLTNYVTQ